MIDREHSPNSVTTDNAERPGRIGSKVARSRRPRRGASLFDPAITRRAIIDAFKKLDPRVQAKNPVMFVVEIGSVITTIEFAHTLLDPTLTSDRGFVAGVAVWLWFTVLFANFAEAMAEGRGKAQADTLRRARSETLAKRVTGKSAGALGPDAPVEEIAAPQLRKGDFVLVVAGDLIPGDGEVIEGVASVDESAITGESAPVIRESGGDRSSVTGGTRVLSDWIIVRISSNPGETFLDRMISLVEGASRQKTPNEIALNILLASLTIIFMLAVVTLEPFAIYSGAAVSIAALIALLVCLIPTTIGGLLSAIGIAGMDRLVQRNVLAMSGRAVEAAGDVDVLLLDKTGTITLGNRMATEFIPVSGVSERELAGAALLSSLPDETPEGRSIVVLAEEKYHLDGKTAGDPSPMTFIPFSASTRMSGVDVAQNGATNAAREVRKGAGDAIIAWVSEGVGAIPSDLRPTVERIARAGGTPLVVAERIGTEPPRVLGVIYLKDIVKSGMSERFEQLRKMGIRTVMITGDNPLTAAAIAHEAGVDDFLAQATPETKMKLIREQQAGGRLVAMTGDGTNDAPALAQADVGVAMNSGTQAAKEAGNMVDLDSNPTKLIEIVEVGKQLLITRGALTTF
ncbi:MAG TPA: potassium-transporting ATPase subunit KdpB, partial [Ktedonobacterales bacterium]|nr:potassium-transporting ATPase subunit KdpB [Ktedonobacterales bacterium]